MVTTTNCILLHIEYSALVQCWSSFPDVCDPIQLVSKILTIHLTIKEPPGNESGGIHMWLTFNKLAQNIFLPLGKNH